MKTFQLLLLSTAGMFVFQSCDKAIAIEKTKETKKAISVGNNTTNTPVVKETYDLNHVVYSSTRGIKNGEIGNPFDCPDDLSFPPIDIKEWDKIPVVNGRFPTYEETRNGTAIHHYGGGLNKQIKVYNINLPRLANVYCKRTGRQETVVVIQVAYDMKDTLVSYRYLNGGCGGSLFRNVRFLSVPEIQSVTRN